jgi:hypothetical protein
MEPRCGRGAGGGESGTPAEVHRPLGDGGCDRAGAACVLIAALLTPGLARADAIDGNWCDSKGGYLEIRGPQILTPGGARMAGDYSRHAFRYVAPDGERHAGATIDMVLADEDTIHLVNVTAPDGTEVWRRCSAPVS